MNDLNNQYSSSSDANSDSKTTEDALVLILDLSPTAWSSGVTPKPEDPNHKIYLHNLYSVVVDFLKSFGYMSVRNKCCMIGTNNAGSKIIYEGSIYKDWLPSCFSGIDAQSKCVETTITAMWNEIVDLVSKGLTNSESDSNLTSAISMGCLYLNRITKSKAGFGRKIIIFDVSSRENYKSQYIGLMNIAFTALKQNITINTLALGQPSRILEQLSTITNAKYLDLSKIFQSDVETSNIEQSLSQLISFWLLPSEEVGEILSTKLSFEFGNTAICYCHYKTVEVSYLCPCCFAVYCSEVDDKGKYRMVCMVCSSRLTRKLLKQKLSSEADFTHN
ncbi:uncharacterized protein TOT_040000918 [Theileria orientalis strain Shintoku]|uniref:RNA polymerase II transcription factor B subunit 4 n=1 Tax=Theileria orientalis strain Shintoku TaxID=869250 RepID=J4C481_THEOR|nr:uncharacterized protein TOT_040000918 [Theileria orientalis strain Shintoku]BAM41726.1 uncharacterized protein TOT_040000918 [Theileria orientalis strain Shintoku]|eukprot:XP_009692027.1 uncharacterized protein TOT_040000918 [Theileria orientalis strain Shintoku]